jgi:tetratricopeptide (TPR) repeat protein
MAYYPEYEKALALTKDQKYEEALVLYNTALINDNVNPDILHDRGVCLFHLKRIEPALDDFNRAAEIQPDYSYRYSSRAFILTAMKKYDEAAADYQKAIELDPEDAVAHNNLGMLYEQMGYARRAKEHFAVGDEMKKMLDAEGIIPESETPPIEAAKAEPVPTPEPLPEATGAPKSSERSGTIKSVFTKRETFREFVRFMSKGFKLDK